MIYEFTGNLDDLHQIVEGVVIDKDDSFENISHQTKPVHIQSIVDNYYAEGTCIMSGIEEFVIIDEVPYLLLEVIPTMVLGNEYTLLGYIPADVDEEVTVQYSICNIRWDELLGNEIHV